MPIKIKPEVSVSGIDGIVANLYSGKILVRSAVVTTNAKYGRAIRELAKSLCPVDTARMRSSIVDEYSPQGLTFVVKFDKSVFDNDGVSYYPVFVEFGTKKSGAQPSLGPAYENLSPVWKEELGRNIRDALRRTAA